MDASVFAMLSSKNIKKNDIQIFTSKDKVKDLIDDKVDIVSIYLSNELYTLKQKGIDVNIFNPKDYGFDFYADILYTSTNETKNHKQRALNFQEASIKGWKYAFF